MKHEIMSEINDLLFAQLEEEPQAVDGKPNLLRVGHRPLPGAENEIEAIGHSPGELVRE